MSAFIIAGAVIGWWVDSYYLSSPIGITSGVIVGTFGGVAKLLSVVLKADEYKNENDL